MKPLLSLLCIVLLFGSTAMAKSADSDAPAKDSTKKDKADKEKEREWSVCEDLIHGFKFRYPTEWEVRKGTSEIVVVTLVSGLPPEGHSADVVTVSCVEEKKKKLDLDLVMDAAEKNAAENLKGLKIVSKGSVKLDGHSARKLVFTGKAENGVDVETTTIFMLLEDGRFFAITMVCDPDRHEDFQPIMKEVMGSFKTFEPK